MANTVEVTDTTFEQEVLKADTPVLVDFWAPWCGPCKMVAPILDEVSEQRGDQLKVVKVNIDEHQKHAFDLRVMTVPTLLLFKDGEVVERINGAPPKRTITNLLDQHLGEPVARG